MTTLSPELEASVNDLRAKHTKLVDAINAYRNGTVTLSKEEMAALAAEMEDTIPLEENALLGQIARAGGLMPSLLLDFEARKYAFGTRRLETFCSLQDILTFTRSSGGGLFNQFGLYEWVGADVPRIDHDPATLSTSATANTLGTGSKTFTTTYAYPVGETVVVSYDANNYMIGKVLASSATAVTLNVLTVVGSGTYSAWKLIVRQGLLVEESRTNLFQYNDVTLPLGGADGRGAISAFTGSHPFSGVSSAARVEMNGSQEQYYAYRTTIPLAVGQKNTRSVYINPELNVLEVGMGAISSDPYFFRYNLTDGTVRANGAKGFVEHIGNNWYRISVTPANVSTVSSQLFIACVTPIDPNSPSSFLYAACQTEAGEFPTSYIPTAGAAVTRAGESALREIGASGVTGKGTLVVEWVHQRQAAISACASVGSPSLERMYLRVSGNDFSVVLFPGSPYVNYWPPAVQALIPGEVYKCAASFDASTGDYSYAIRGAGVDYGYSGRMQNAKGWADQDSKLIFGNFPPETTANGNYGVISAYWFSSVLPLSQLQELTS